MMHPNISESMLVDLREEFRKVGEYEIADKLRDYLFWKKQVEIVDGVSVTYFCETPKDRLDGKRNEVIQTWTFK